MKQIETATLHRGVAGARHTFLPLPPTANKLDLLLQVRDSLHGCSDWPWVAVGWGLLAPICCCQQAGPAAAGGVGSIA